MRPINRADRDFQFALSGGSPTTGAGPSKRTSTFIHKRVQFGGSMTSWAVKLQGTVDGVNWVDIGPTMTSAGIVEVPEYWSDMRINSTSVGSSTNITVTLGGFAVGD